MAPMLRSLLRIALLTGLLLATGRAASPVWAQDQPDQPALPDIAPREIEIRGTLDISLPSLQRQPLSGFNPPPRIPTIPQNRKPYVGSYRPDREDLPHPVPDPPPLQAQLDPPAPPLDGELEAGGGRYFTRFAAARLWVPLSTHESLTLDGDYEGSAGFAPFDAQPDVESPFDTFTGQIGLQSRRDRLSFNADLEGFYDTYTLYGARINDQNPIRRSVAPQPDRAAGHVRARAALQTHGTTSFGVSAQISGTEYETTVLQGTPTNDRLLAERRMTIGGHLEVPIGQAAGRLDATVTTAGLGADPGFENDITAVDGGVRATLVTAPSLRVHLGGRLLSASVSPAANPAFPDRNSARFLVPAFNVDWTATAAATLFLKNEPAVTTSPLADLFQENPYLFGQTAVQPSLRTTDAEGGVRLFTGPLQVVARAGYRYTVSHQYVTHTAEVAPPPDRPLYDRGTFATQYGSARVIHAGVDLSLQRMRGFEITAGASYRNGRLVGRDVAIPYFAPITAYGVASFAFAAQRGLVQLTGRVEGSRYIDTSESTQIDPYVDVDVDASFDVTSSLAVIARLHNLLGGTFERWDRYPQPPFVVTTGLRVQW